MDEDICSPWPGRGPGQGTGEGPPTGGGPRSQTQTKETLSFNQKNAERFSTLHFITTKTELGKVSSLESKDLQGKGFSQGRL